MEREKCLWQTEYTVEISVGRSGRGGGGGYDVAGTDYFCRAFEVSVDWCNASIKALYKAKGDVADRRKKEI